MDPNAPNSMGGSGSSAAELGAPGAPGVIPKPVPDPLHQPPAGGPGSPQLKPGADNSAPKPDLTGGNSGDGTLKTGEAVNRGLADQADRTTAAVETDTARPVADSAILGANADGSLNQRTINERNRGEGRTDRKSDDIGEQVHNEGLTPEQLEQIRKRGTGAMPPDADRKQPTAEDFEKRALDAGMSPADARDPKKNGLAHAMATGQAQPRRGDADGEDADERHPLERIRDLETQFGMLKNNQVGGDARIPGGGVTGGGALQQQIDELRARVDALSKQADKSGSAEPR